MSIYKERMDSDNKLLQMYVNNKNVVCLKL